MGLHQNSVNVEQASLSKHITVWNDVVDDRSNLELLGDCHLLPHEQKQLMALCGQGCVTLPLQWSLTREFELLRQASWRRCFSSSNCLMSSQFSFFLVKVPWISVAESEDRPVRLHILAEQEGRGEGGGGG